MNPSLLAGFLAGFLARLLPGLCAALLAHLAGQVQQFLGPQGGLLGGLLGGLDGVLDRLSGVDVLAGLVTRGLAGPRPDGLAQLYELSFERLCLFLYEMGKYESTVH